MINPLKLGGAMAAKQRESLEALRMLDAFASVGAEQFDLTITDLQGNKLTFRRNQPLITLRQILPARIPAITKQQQNIIVRPTGKAIVFVQLDDLNHAGLDRMTPAAFMTLETSPGNYQAWVALRQPISADFIRRLRQGAGADPCASGATRVAGSRNFKEKYAPDFPCVTISHIAPGLVATTGQLETLGLVAPPPVFLSRPIRQRRFSHGARNWPSYDLCLAGAPVNKQAGPDKSRADFTWCMIAIDWGWGIEATATQLMEISDKARENGEGYAIRTAESAAAAVARKRQAARPAPD